MKDELGGAILSEFVGLRSKMYSLKYAPEHSKRDTRKAKGIGQAAVYSQNAACRLCPLFDGNKTDDACFSCYSKYAPSDLYNQTNEAVFVTVR